MADTTQYKGDVNKVVNSNYLYEMMQDFKDAYVDTKVEQAAGKGLSSNDFTNDLKTSYDGAVTKAHTHSNKAVLDGITTDKITAWDEKADTGHTHSNYASTVTTTGSGNAITAISQSGNAITATKGSTFLTSHPSISAGTNTTTTAAPALGGSFTCLGSVTKDTNGHVTAFETKTVTIPALSFEATALDFSSLT